MTLEELGWSSHFSEAFRPYENESCIPARVCIAHRAEYWTLTPSGEFQASLSGKLRHAEMLPAVGDWVVLREGRVIEAVLPRRTQFSRKQAGARTEEQVLAANLDVLFVVAGLDGDFNLRRLERYLLLAWESGAAPVLVLNKADLHPDPGSALAQARSIAFGAPVVLGSAMTGEGLDGLALNMNRGQTGALIGSSGAGKSTIVNHLLGHERQQVRAVREHDSRGRHTTTRRELIPMPGGWMLMDLPGLRELQLWGSGEGMEKSFPEVTEIAAQCRFRDCRHEGEPGCAVAETVDEERLQSYRKLRRELDYLARKQDQSAALEEKRRWKRIHKAMRRMK